MRIAPWFIVVIALLAFFIYLPRTTDGLGRRRHLGAGDLLAEPLFCDPLRRHDCAPVSDGAAAIVLAAGDRARSVADRPAWITGFQHRTDAQALGVRDLTRSPSAAAAGEAAGVEGVDTAEVYAPFSHQEPILRRELGLDESVTVNPSGGPLCGNPMFSAGLVRIGEAAAAAQDRREVNGQGAEAEIEFRFSVDAANERQRVAGYDAERFFLTMEAEAEAAPEGQTEKEEAGTLVVLTDMWTSRDIPLLQARSAFDDPTTWSVFDPEGTWLGDVEVPPHFVLQAVFHKPPGHAFQQQAMNNPGGNHQGDGGRDARAHPACGPGGRRFRHPHQLSADSPSDGGWIGMDSGTPTGGASAIPSSTAPLSSR